MQETWNVIKQLQITYDAEADRLLLVFEGEEIQKAWVTRRLMLLVWPKLLDLIEQRFDKNAWAMIDLPKQAVSKDYRIEHSAKTPPLMQLAEGGCMDSFLSHRLTMNFGDNEAIVFHFLDKNDMGILIHLSNEMLSVFIKILMQSLQTAGWDLPMDKFKEIDQSHVAVSIPYESGEEKKLH